MVEERLTGFVISSFIFLDLPTCPVYPNSAAIRVSRALLYFDIRALRRSQSSLYVRFSEPDFVMLKHIMIYLCIYRCKKDIKFLTVMSPTNSFFVLVLFHRHLFRFLQFNFVSFYWCLNISFYKYYTFRLI